MEGAPGRPQREPPSPEPEGGWRERLARATGFQERRYARRTDGGRADRRSRRPNAARLPPSLRASGRGLPRAPRKLPAGRQGAPRCRGGGRCPGPGGRAVALGFAPPRGQPGLSVGWAAGGWYGGWRLQPAGLSDPCFLRGKAARERPWPVRPRMALALQCGARGWERGCVSPRGAGAQEEGRPQAELELGEEGAHGGQAGLFSSCGSRCCLPATWLHRDLVLPAAQ